MGRLATKEPAVVTKNSALTAKANMLRLLENARNGSLKRGCSSSKWSEVFRFRMPERLPFLSSQQIHVPPPNELQLLSFLVHRNTTSPSPPPRSNRGANVPIPSTSKGGQGDPHPRPPTSTSPKKNAKRRINRPPPHTDDPIAMFSRYGVLDVEGGGGSDAE